MNNYFGKFSQNTQNQHPTYVDFKRNKVFIRNVLTHAEYNKGNWKKDDWYQ